MKSSGPIDMTRRSGAIPIQALINSQDYSDQLQLRQNTTDYAGKFMSKNSHNHAAQFSQSNVSATGALHNRLNSLDSHNERLLASSQNLNSSKNVAVGD